MPVYDTQNRATKVRKPSPVYTEKNPYDPSIVKIMIHPERMVVDAAYCIEYKGQNLELIKNKDGTIDIYRPATNFEMIIESIKGFFRRPKVIE